MKSQYTRQLETLVKVRAFSEAREALREWIVDLSRTARAIGREHPEVRSKFRLPSGIGDEALLEGARAFARNAVPLQDIFIAHELPPTFLQDLEAAIARLESVAREQTANRGVRIRATASLTDGMDQAMDALYRLDGMVPNKIKKNPALVREWEAARHLAAARSAKRTEGEPTPPDGAAKASAA